MKHRIVLLTLVSLLVSFSGCKVGPDYVKPETSVPDAWTERVESGISGGDESIENWWLQLDDPVLTNLIRVATENNYDLKVAAARVKEAKAQLGVATGAYYPQIDALGQYERGRPSENGLPGGPASDTNLHTIGLDASWEIDLFGRISRSVESAQASLQASVEDYHDVLIVLYAEVARNYVTVRSLQEGIRYTRNNIDLQRETLQLVKDRFAAELVPRLDVVQAESNLANTEASIFPLQQALTEAVNRIGVLIGEQPGVLNDELRQYANIPNVPDIINVSMPVEVIRNRPDIRAAERRLAAQTALVGVATADLYPTFSLFGVFALEAQQLADLGSWDSRTYGFGPSFEWNVFDGNRIRNQIKIHEARTEALLNQYENTVLKAMEEVEDAMSAYALEQGKLKAIQRSVVALKESVELVNTLYKSGLTDFQNVLDMQRTLSLQQNKLAESRGLVAVDLIRLYKALGGGWNFTDNSVAKEEGQDNNSISG